MSWPPSYLERRFVRLLIAAIAVGALLAILRWIGVAE